MTCSKCGGPVRSNNRIGICIRNPNCRNAHDRAAHEQNRGTARAISRDYQRALPREVRQANALRAIHGLNPAEKQAMLDTQGGRCYLCGDPLAYDEAVIDHDHRCCADVIVSGARRTTSCGYCRRGLACGGCNTLIGMAGDDAEKLRRIAESLAAALTVVHARLATKPQQPALFEAVPCG